MAGFWSRAAQELQDQVGDNLPEVNKQFFYGDVVNGYQLKTAMFWPDK